MYFPNKTVCPSPEIAPSEGNILVVITTQHSSPKVRDRATPLDSKVEVEPINNGEDKEEGNDYEEVPELLSSTTKSGCKVRISEQLIKEMNVAAND